jgi:hypothetical protein
MPLSHSLPFMLLGVSSPRRHSFEHRAANSVRTRKQIRCENGITPRSSILLEKQPIAQLLKKFPIFVEPEGSLPCSAGPSTGPSLTHSLTHGAEPFLRSCQLCSHSRNSQHFMELESSLPCSQKPSTGPYPEPDQSNP